MDIENLDGRKLYEIYEEENDANGIAVDDWLELDERDRMIWECMANRLKGL